uniref:Galactosyltransferase C-terminal domain-containing protein n=1 Tax=Chromera velia CCMP2878 TaxID=1169474 RepID=A0A0G4HA13_9ALVE|eukprot:Cvel_6039.t1-p1 / transcript=Cvel_6039.t1 / gene=Cvel_6039 / organism=Chromera_velia_CCMP2878 / gene_product=Beta-1,4-galactosyltransferase 7, putative / transcript_product=Beta-1,4-galactosyltransferase 7, putative / location=Cvel_scaffold290:9237-11679(-) / protein_length=325 / sequence_SO=supercontig / SO=protein_coding / is_pseudo=false
MDEEEAPRGAGGQPSPSPSGWKPMSKAAALALISKVSREAKEEGGTDRAVIACACSPLYAGLLINCGALAVKSLCRNGWHLRKGTGCGCEWGREDEKKTEKEEGEQGDLLLRLTTIVTHDVDTLPRGRQWEFTHTGGQCRQYWGTRAGEVRHLYGHSHSLGGTVAVSWEDFVRCNGFSNDLWGWGWEDVDFFRRVVGRGLSVDRGGFVERILVQKGEGRGRRALPCPFEESGGQEIEESVESEMGVDAGKYIGTERSWKGEGSDRRACEGETRGRQFASLFDKVKTGEAKRNERLCESKKGSVSEGKKIGACLDGYKDMNASQDR